MTESEIKRNFYTLTYRLVKFNGHILVQRPPTPAGYVPMGLQPGNKLKSGFLGGRKKVPVSGEEVTTILMTHKSNCRK